MQVQLKNHPVVDWVWVTMSPGAYQKFAIFVVEILDGNTAEYKPCAQFEGRFHEQQVRVDYSHWSRYLETLCSHWLEWCCYASTLIP